MALSAGTRLGSYEILAPLGAGGMGEVYRATDTKLGRDVAIKILPGEVAGDPERLQRFQREAHLLAALNHPHIAAIYGLEEAADQPFLVLELVEGQTLADRIAQGPIPVDDALPTARQIAEALHAAHGQGIVHRDLKPGNVILAKSGAKLLDFGLARQLSSGAPAPESHLPTAAAPLTTEGTLVGTLHYMAPEQLEGREVDVRADVWALGCILYEMVSGDRPFGGESQASLIGSILKESPRPLAEVTPLTPRRLAWLVERCLAKDPEERWQSARDVSLELEALGQEPADGSDAASAGRRLPWVAVAGGVLLAGLLGAVAGRILPMNTGDQEAPIPEVSLRQLTGRPASDTVHAAALSPDRESLAFATEAGLFLQLVATGEERQIPLPQELRIHEVDWLEGGSTLLFRAAASDEVGLYKTSIFGGTPSRIADDAFRVAVSNDGERVAYLPHPSTAIYIVNAEGGARRTLAQADGSTSFWEIGWSPDDRWLLAGSWDGSKTLNCTLIAIDVASGETHDVLKDQRFFQNWRGFLPFAWTPAGELIVGRREIGPNSIGSNLWKVSIDAATARPLGVLSPLTQLVGVNFKDLVVSSDGNALSFLLERNQQDVLVAEINEDGDLGEVRLLVADTRTDEPLAWSPDHETLFFATRRAATGELYRIDRASTRAQRVADRHWRAPNYVVAAADGRSLLFWGTPTQLQRVPVVGGPVVDVLTAGGWPGHRCSVDRSTCLLGERSPDGRSYALFALDWEKGRGEEVLRFTNESTFSEWDLSPDGTRVVASGRDDRLRVFELATGRETVLDIPGWHYGEFPRWAADGQGVYVDGSPLTRGPMRRGLLHISLDGEVRSLRQNWNEWITFPVPTADGKQLAFASQVFSGNVWMLKDP